MSLLIFCLLNSAIPVISELLLLIYISVYYDQDFLTAIQITQMIFNRKPGIINCVLCYILCVSILLYILLSCILGHVQIT